MASRHLSRLWIRNLPFTVSHQELRDHFTQFGRVVGSKVVFDHQTGFGAKYGFIDFAELRSADQAIKRSPQFLDGNYIEQILHHIEMENYVESDLEALFCKATDYVASGTLDVLISDRLFFYSRYKQATEGPCNIPKPGLFDLQGRKKWEAWTHVKHLTKKEAKHQYITKLNEIDPDWEIFPATKTGWVSVSTMMREELCDPSEKDVFDFVKENDFDKVKMLSVEEFERRDENQMTPLHWACDRGHLEMVRHLLNVHQNINEQDSEGQTALHYASSCGHENVVKILLENGADLNSKDCDGLRPIDCAEEETVKALFNV